MQRFKFSFIHNTRGMKHPAMSSFSDEPGQLCTLDLLHPHPHLAELQIRRGLGLSSFNPHGISTYVNQKVNRQLKHTMFKPKKDCMCWDIKLNHFLRLSTLTSISNFEKETIEFLPIIWIAISAVYVCRRCCVLVCPQSPKTQQPSGDFST